MPEQLVRFIRLPEVRRRCAISAMTVWRLEKAGRFPRHVALGPHSTAWVEAEIEKWCRDKVMERDSKISDIKEEQL